MKASILINNYNYGRFLDHCLRSALAQTHADVEVILYDDGSRDHSAEVWARYPQVKVIARPNHGAAPSFNQAHAIHQAFLQSSGEIICLLDSDDAFLPDKVARVVAAFARRPELVMVQHRMHEIDATGHRTGRIRSNIMAGVDIKRAIYATGALEYFFMQTSGLSFRRRLLAQVLPVDETRFPLIWADVRLSRAAIFLGDVATVFEPLGEYRAHPAGDSNKLKDPAIYREVRRQHYAYFNALAQAHAAPPLPDQSSRRAKARVVAHALTCRQPPQQKLTFLARSLGALVGRG